MRRGPLVAIALSAIALAGCSSDGASKATEDASAGLIGPSSDAALDELFVAVDATRAQPTGRFTTESPLRSTKGAYESSGISVRADGRPEVRVVGTKVYLPSSLFPKVNATTTWLSVSLDDLAPLENRSPGLADEVAALAGAAPPGVGPALAALRTSTRAGRTTDGTLMAQLDLSNMEGVNPRDRDAVVAWAGLWARDGGPRTVAVKVSMSSNGLLQQVIFDPDGDTDAGPSTLKFTDLGTPVTVNTPFAADTTPLK